MSGTKLDFQAIQYLNLFSRITGTRASNCFNYSNFIIFEVPPFMMSKTIGENGANVKRLEGVIKKRIKVIAKTQDISEFIQSLIYPIKFKKITIENNEVIIFAQQQSKAMLIGRGSLKFEELKDILKIKFDVKKLRII